MRAEVLHTDSDLDKNCIYLWRHFDFYVICPLGGDNNL